MIKLFKLTGSEKPRRSRSKQHKQTRYRYVTKAAVSFMAPLLFVGALILPHTARSADENGPPICSIEQGMIDAQSEFTADSSGNDFKITCKGALADHLDESSIMSLLDSRGDAYQPGVSKMLLDLNGVTSDNHGLSFDVDGALNILTGQLNNNEDSKDGSAVWVYGETLGEDEVAHDVNAENRATIVVKGDGRRALSVYHEFEDGNVNVDNYGMITTEGDGFDRRTDDNPNNDKNWARRANGIQAGVDSASSIGDIVVTNKAGATVHVKGSGARGIQAGNDGTGDTTVHNYGTVKSEGAIWEGYRPYAISAWARHGSATAINHEDGNITTGIKGDASKGQQGSGISVSIGGEGVEVAGSVTATNHGTITTYGDHTAHGMAAWVDSVPASRMVVKGTNSGTIKTEGDGADGMNIFARSSTNPESNVVVTNSGSIEVNGNHPSDGITAGLWMNRDEKGDSASYSGDSLGTVTVTNTVTGTVKTTGNGEKLEDGDIDFVAAIAGGFWARQGNDERPGNVIENSGDAFIINDGEVIATGHRTAGLFGRTVGSGNLKITTRGDIHAGTMGEKFGIGIWGGAFTDGEVRDATTSEDVNTDVDVMIVVEGSTINAYGAATDDPDSDYDESNGIAILTGSGPESGHAEVNIRDATVSAYGKDGGYAVLFDPGRGTLNLSDSTIVGNIEFVGSDDDVLNISGSKTTSITGDIMGLEMLNKDGTGNVRFNGDVNAEGSMLNLNEGSLIIAGKLDLNDGTLTIKQAGKLVFEINSATEHGSLSADLLHFQGDDASVFAQLNADLTTEDASAVRNALAGESIQLLDVVEITSGSNQASVDSVMVKSQSADGDADVGTVSSNDGMALFKADLSALSHSGRTGTGGGTEPNEGGTMMPGDGMTDASSSSSGGAVLGIGLLAVLMSSFMADEDASASYGDYYFNTPQSAYIAQANERGVMTIKETGNQPYQMWIRTGQTAQPMRMTGVSNSGVSGTEVGVNLYNSDTFYINTSVAPNVAAEVGSLNLAAKGEVYSLSSGWRNDRYFGGLRVSHGEFEVNSIVDNPIVNSALISNAKLRNTQAQLRAGMNLSTGALRFTPSASIQVGTYENSEHVAESPALEAAIPSYAQDYTSVQLGLKMTSDKWLSFTNGSKWKPQLKFDSIHTDSTDAGSLTLRQSDKAGALSFNTNAGLRSMPDVVNSMSFGAKVKSSTNDQAEWKFGFAGLEADGEEYYAAMAAYQLRF